MPERPDDKQFERTKAVLGIDAETFLQTPLGKYIMQRCDRQEAKAIEELLETQPTDVAKCTEIRDEIYRLRSLPMFIQDAIQEGRIAVQNLEVMESYEENQHPGGNHD